MQIRDRIKRFCRVKASQLKPNPKNWRAHGDAQRDALRGVLSEVGYADALLARELPDGSLELIDGHLRAETTPDVDVPVLILDVTPEEADKILLTHDPIAAMAGHDPGPLADLMQTVQTQNDAVRAMIDNLVDATADMPEPPPARPEIDIPESYQVVVECADETEQQAVYEQMRNEGRRCRVLTL